MKPNPENDWLSIYSYSWGNSEVSIVELCGRIDVLKASKLRQTIVSTNDDRSKLVLFDMQDVSFLDSAGLGSLIFGAKHVTSCGGEVAFCSLHDQPKALFDLTNMAEVFDIYADRESFTLAKKPQ